MSDKEDGASAGNGASAGKEPSANKEPSGERDNAADEQTVVKQPKTGKVAGSSKPARPSSQSSVSISGVLGVILALVALGLASYPAYESYQRLSQPVAEPVDVVTPKLASVEASLGALDQRLSAFESRLATALNPSSDDAARQAFEASVAAEIAQLRGRIGTSAKDWIYAEVEYLIRMANQRVLMEQDAVSALQLLQSADNIIRDADGLSAHGLRAALAKDIAALKSVNAPDVQGVYLELAALIHQVPELKRSLPAYQAPDTLIAENDDNASFVAKLLSLVRNAASRLAGLVDFRRGQVEVTPILPPREAYYLRQNLVLKLQMAQLALLDGRETVYRASLREAHNWVAASFDAADPTSIAMLEALSSLSETSVAVDLPDVSASLVEVRDLVGGLRGVEDQ